MADDQPNLQRSLSLTSLSFYGTGMILGAGIYSIIGPAVGLTGQSLWLSFIAAAIAATLTALSYCELASMMPKAGAEFIYLKEAFPAHRNWGKWIGMIMAFAGVSTAAAVAMAFGGYLKDFIPFSPPISAFAILAAMTALNAWGIQESSRANVVFTLIETLGLVLFIAFGFDLERIQPVLASVETSKVLPGAALIIFAFFGFEDIVNLGEEAKQPEKSVPRAILISLFISTVIYILVSLVAVVVATPEALSQGEAPLMSAVQADSPRLARVLGICALFSTANTVLIALLAASRSFYGMAKEASFPEIFGRVSAVRHSPWRASVFVFFVAVLLLPLRRVDEIASVSSLATLIGFFSVHVSLIALRLQQPERQRPFHLPGQIGKWPILPVLGAFSTILLMAQFELSVYLWTLVFLLGIFLIERLLSRKFSKNSL